jgi:phage-related minor tail protein
MLVEWKELYQGILKFMEIYKKEFKVLKSICKRRKKLIKMFVAHSISEIYFY